MKYYAFIASFLLLVAGIVILGKGGNDTLGLMCLILANNEFMWYRNEKADERHKELMDKIEELKSKIK